MPALEDNVQLCRRSVVLVSEESWRSVPCLISDDGFSVCLTKRPPPPSTRNQSRTPYPPPYTPLPPTRTPFDGHNNDTRELWIVLNLLFIDITALMAPSLSINRWYSGVVTADCGPTEGTVKLASKTPLPRLLYIYVYIVCPVKCTNRNNGVCDLCSLDILCLWCRGTR